MKVLVEALQNFPYDHADRKIGDKFECDAEHARVFNVHGKTKMVNQTVDESLPEKTDLPGNKPLPTESYQSSSQTAEDDTSEDAVERRRNKRYKRRDMRPEG